MHRFQVMWRNQKGKKCLLRVNMEALAIVNAICRDGAHIFSYKIYKEIEIQILFRTFVVRYE